MPSPVPVPRLVAALKVAAALLGLAGAANAQDISEQDYFANLPVVLTVSRLAQPISETPGAVTVIDRKTILDLNARDMVDVLRLVPGYHVSGYNGANPVGVYHAPLDEFGSRNLVLVDGRPVYSSYYFGGTARGLMAVDPEDIERVEVLRGANSAAYGANAMFGVINIVTRHSVDTRGTQVSARLGGGGIRDGRVSLGLGDAGASLRLSAARRSDHGLPGLFDNRDLRQLRLRADLRASAQDELEIEAGVSDLQAGDGYPGDVGNPARTVNWRDWHLNGQWRRQLSDTEQLKVALSLSREALTDRFDFLPVPGIVVDFSGVGRRLDLELQHQFNLSDTLRLVWGAGARTEQAQSLPLFYRPDALSFTESRLFGNLEWRPSAHWLINGGLFLGQHSWTGGYATPRLMANYQLAPDHTLRFGVNRSVRPPTLFELAADVRYDLGGVTIGRTFASRGNVVPEQLLSHEIGYFANLRERRLTLDVRVFREKMDGFIRTVTYQLPVPVAVTGTAVLDSTNFPGPVTSGIEYQLRWSPAPGTDLWLNQSFTDMNWQGRQELATAPAHALTVAAFHELPNRLKLGLVLSHRSRMFWRGVGVMDFSVRQLDLHLSYPFRVGSRQARAALTVRGLDGGQRQYVSSFASPVSKRHAYASLQVEF